MFIYVLFGILLAVSEREIITYIWWWLSSGDEWVGIRIVLEANCVYDIATIIDLV